MKIVKNTTSAIVPAIGTVEFEPFARAGEYWRTYHGYTHTQRFEFEANGRSYWGEIIRLFDKQGGKGKRVSYYVKLRTRVALSDAKTIAHNHKLAWRAALIEHFKEELEAWLTATQA